MFMLLQINGFERVVGNLLTLGLFQVDSAGPWYERIFDKYGWPTLILAIIAGFFYKAIWPRIVQYLDDVRQRDIQAHETLKEHAKNLESREDTLLKEFKDSLVGLKETIDSNTQRNQAQINLLEEVAMAVHEQGERLKNPRGK